MTTQTATDHDIALYKKGRKKGFDQWYVKVSCNVLSARTYGPFPSKDEALHFREGAEFELRKLLDFQLRIRSGGYGIGIPQREDKN